MLREFAAGFGMLGRGFGFWRRRPRLMLLGLVPAAIAFVLLAAALITLGVQLPALVDWATPFADSWDGFWQGVLRFTIALIVFAGAAVLAVVTFTALTLVIGDPFYERIWRAVEQDLGGPVPDEGGGFWRSVVDALQLVGLGLVVAVVAGLAGLIPVVGTVLGAVLGVVLTGRLLVRELTGRAFEARGLSLEHRRALRRANRWRTLGFGVATQLCFLVPLGAVATMPAAVAGATMLARQLLDRDSHRAPPQPS
ncbi:EI24 domain-containing protein [Agromyces aerolatus]|uniref:EI24 domain-containing protein n=1 Tax=Agromyces sp. LY-1074 TaxID=3074080 RepID=UPI002855DA0A|nr:MULTISPECIES: EI24 domain-containing protein [unclassified Agromyces]MDR5699680.1 EI24 domain-containing protein [Agromyces sp. LY-1074]MDR5705976.1 EI24 domain-containing protein [Agromyces sp. LY-1358]